MERDIYCVFVVLCTVYSLVGGLVFVCTVFYTFHLCLIQSSLPFIPISCYDVLIPPPGINKVIYPSICRQGSHEVTAGSVPKRISDNKPMTATIIQPRQLSTVTHHTDSQ